MEQIISSLRALQLRLKDILTKLDLDQKRINARELEAQSLKSDFWANQEEAKKVMTNLTELQNEINEVTTIEDRLKNALEMASLASHEHQDLAVDLENEVNELTTRINSLESRLFLSGSYDRGGAIVSIHAGQGGTEAMDWAEMLLRMYLRYFEKQKWVASIIDESRGEEAGIKSVTVHVEGGFAYGYLKKEAGTHRLVRQSPFNADHLRQTSFALVEVLPIIEETTDLVINQEDIKMESFRSSGAGGQNVQKVNSAVRLIHLPTGLSASVQTERSQLQNREYAMRILRAKLWALEEAKRQGEIKSLKGEYRPASWGNQIRSYVLHPYQMVKDLRTGYETSDSAGVLNGDIGGFIEAELRV